MDAPLQRVGHPAHVALPAFRHPLAQARAGQPDGVGIGDAERIEAFRVRVGAQVVLQGGKGEGEGGFWIASGGGWGRRAQKSRSV
jgi:hypothetical protein